MSHGSKQVCRGSKTSGALRALAKPPCCSGRQDLNHPATAVGGICSELIKQGLNRRRRTSAWSGLAGEETLLVVTWAAAQAQRYAASQTTRSSL